MYKDKNLDKTPTARELMDIIVESREWKDTDFCSFPLGKSIITLSKYMWNHHLLYEDYHLQEYDKRKGTFVIDKYYSSPEAAFLELLQTYDEIGYRTLKGYIEDEKENWQCAKIEKESLLQEVRILHNNTPSGVIHDADTIFADIMKENCRYEGDFYAISGIAEAIFSIWENSADRVSVEKIFDLFTGMEFKNFLEKCKNEITRNPADMDHEKNGEEQEEER